MSERVERSEAAGGANGTSGPDLTRLLLWGSVALITLVAFETLAVTTAMPSIAADLDGAALYALAFGVPMAAQLFTTPVAGHLCDRAGARLPLLVGLGMFVAGVLLCGVAPTMPVFVLGRLVQGLGAGFLVVPLYVLVGALVEPERRGTFFAAFAAAWVVPSMIGPPLAGVVVEQWDWRWIFLAVAPLTLLATVLLLPVLRRLTTPRDPAPAADAIPTTAGTGRGGARRLLIAALVAGIATALLQSLSASADATTARSLPAWAVVLLAVAAVAGLWWSLPSLLPDGTMRLARGLPAVVGGRALLNGAFISAEIFLPLMLQQVHGWRPSHAGIVLTVGSLTWAVGSAVQARVRDDETRYRLVARGPWLIVAGMGLVALAVLTTPWLALVGWGVAGLGIGLAFPALSVLALAITPTERHGRMSSALQIADTLGAALAIAVIGIVVALLAGASGGRFVAGLALAAGLAALAALAGRRARPRQR